MKKFLRKMQKILKCTSFQTVNLIMIREKILHANIRFNLFKIHIFSVLF
jgi:hypothetical protein